MASLPCLRRKSPQNKHKLVIDPYAANVIKEIYDLYMAGAMNPSPCSIKCKRNLRFICLNTADRSSFSLTWLETEMSI